MFGRRPVPWLRVLGYLRRPKLPVKQIETGYFECPDNAPLPMYSNCLEATIFRVDKSKKPGHLFNVLLL